MRFFRKFGLENSSILIVNNLIMIVKVNYKLHRVTMDKYLMIITYVAICLFAIS